MKTTLLLLLSLLGCTSQEDTDPVDTQDTSSGEETGDTGEEVEATPCQEAGYQEPTQGISSRGELEQVLRGLTGLRDCDYTQSTHWMFTRLDKHDGVVECVYTGRTTVVSSDKPDDDDMNTEHTWPRSQGADSEPALCDLHHLYPTDSDANATRASYPLGEVSGSTEWSSGGSRLGRDAGGDKVFEPRDEHKGDAARSMLYVAMRYGASLASAQRQLYGAWHQADPPDEVEIKRSQDIGSYQGHANPYVVCPHLVEVVSR